MKPDDPRAPVRRIWGRTSTGPDAGRPRRLRTLLLAGACLLALAVSALLSASPDDPVLLLPGDRQVLESQGARIVQCIQAFKAGSGRWPESLTETGLGPADTSSRFGPWRYETRSTGHPWSLSVGDYERNQFILGWDHGTGSWSWDT